MAEFADLRKSRGYIKGKLTRLRKQVTEASTETGFTFDKEQADTRLEKLEEIRRQFDTIQGQLLDAFTDEDAKEDEHFEAGYFEVKALLKRCINQFAREDTAASENTGMMIQLLRQQSELIQQIGRGARGEAPAATLSVGDDNETIAAILSRQTEILDRVASAAGSNHIDARVKLPTIKLPHFDGKIEDWKCFLDNFRSIIHNKPQLSGIEKFQYLVSSISGDAAKVIESIELTEQNYATAWELLQQRYNDPRSLKKKHIQCLFTMPTVTRESAKALRELIDHTSRHMRMLKVLGSPTDRWDELIMHMMETRFDVRTLRAWEEEIERIRTIRTGEEAAEQNDEANLEDMLEFLRKKCQTLERIETRANDKSHKECEQRGKVTGNGSAKTHSAAKGTVNQKTISLATSLNSGKCYFCQGAHYIYFCEKFLELPIPERIKEVKRLKLCINCLKNDHYAKTCKMGHCRECSEKHNTLCHLTPAIKDSVNSKVPGSTNEEKSEGHSSVAVHASSGANGRRVLMATAIVEVSRGNGSDTPMRVLLDSASEANFITQAAYNKLGLKRNRVSETIMGLNEIENKISHTCNVHVKSRCSNFEIGAQCLIVPRITKNLPSMRIDCSKVQIPNNLNLADVEFHKIGPIDMLIGAEFFFDLLEPGKIEVGKNQLILQNTKFGWVVAGLMPLTALINLNCNQNALSSLTCSFKAPEVLSENLERFWELENYNDEERHTLSIDEKKCEQIFEQTTTRDNDGRFVVRLPFRDSYLSTGNNREIALKRLNSLERVLKGNSVVRERYVKFMREYFELRHMSVIDSTVDNVENAVYLPHHGVLKESSSSTKLRVVFDASAKNNMGVSLNDALFTGPVLQDNLINIVLRFRFYKVALTADLQKMYRQVLVHPSDRKFQRILWRFSLDEPVKSYCLNTVTYGQSCAPYLVIRCLRQLAVEGKERYSLASAAILNDTYVDDIISGADTIDDARALQRQLSKLLKEGGFEAHKWCSNLEDTLSEVPMNHRETNSNLNLEATDVVSTLGLEWNPVPDEFCFKVLPMGSVLTKRKMLSAISKLFDPLGLIGPVLTTAKILMQGLWQIKMDWDDPLPKTILDKWENFQEGLKDADTIRVPRVVISPVQNSQFVIHGFCDASESAYGACIYVQSIKENGEIEVGLLCSKARVAPLKKLSIPRLELCSALLLAKLINNVKQAIRVPINGIFAWSDSTVALCWIHGDLSRWKSFVSNRVSDIIKILPASHWRHVKGSENPADLISRGATPIQLKNSSLWWKGPNWLDNFPQLDVMEECNWNINTHIQLLIDGEAKGESRVCNLNAQQVTTLDEIIHRLMGNCSTLTRMERTLAYCFRYISNCRRKREDRILSGLTLTEIDLARREIIKYSQRIYFLDELKSLQSRGRLSRTSKLQQLQAFLDVNGVLRVGGRLQEALYNFERKHPILLPAQCKFTRLMIEREHRTLLHAGPQLLLASIRQQYWPLNARNLVRQVCRSCIWCVKNNPKGLTQAMGSLPSERIQQPTKAFTITGVDFAGPIITLVNKGRGRKTCKSYIALFVCFATRAIHLEATSELSTAAFMAALRRFVGRRGVPRKICSDNATNFVGAKRELEELYAFIRNSINGSMGDALTEKGIEWSFIPPYSPHLGGLWEAGVKSCKYHLKRVMGNTLYTFEELSTLLTQIEACLNSRPLSPLSADPSDLQPLTPGHFLVGGPLTSLPEINLSDVNINRLDRWQMIQRAVQDFWKRWAAEYIGNLQSRTKWKTIQENLKINDLVLLKEENLPPLKWKIGRVVEVYKGKDDLVRIVSVRTSSGITKRAISKLCKLPLNDKVDYKD